MQFPCDFLIKIIGKNTDGFESDLIEIARRFYPELPNKPIKSQLSKNKKYRSLNLRVHAQEQTTLDLLYRALTQHPDVHMVL
jgi:putative lipoic acid-binding regulatory protein